MIKTVMVSKNINLLKWYNFFYDFRPYGAIAVIYFAQVAHSYTLGLAAFSIAAIADSVLELPTGYLSDRIGRKKTVILGSLASVVALSAYSLADSFTLLAVGALFNGLARACVSGNNDALLYDTLKAQNRSEDFPEIHGKVSAMFELGLGISALAASLLAFHSLRPVMIASVFPQIVCVLIALFFIEPKVRAEEMAENLYQHLKDALKAFVANVKLRQLSIAYVLDYAIGQAIYDFKPAFNALVWPAWALGIARALDNVFGFLGFHFAGKVMSKFTALKALFGQQVLGTLNSFVFVALPNLVSPVALSANAFFYGVGVTANQTLMHNEFTDKQRATMSSLNSFMGNIVFGVLTFVVGLFADGIGPRKTLLLLAALSIPVLLMYRSLYRRHGSQ